MNPYSAYSDNELISLLISGDEMSYTEIYHRYKGLIYQHAYRRLKDEDEADDVLQDIFTSLWVRRERLNSSINVPAYLYSALRNKVINIIAHKQVRSEYHNIFEKITENNSAVTDHRVRLNLLQELIEKEVANLPPKMREIFEYSRNQHLSHREIAQKLDISEKTVKNQIHNALKILRSRLGIIVYLMIISKIV
jgi:RNA polymerase sigma-70 factor (ECF subfamily)